MVAWSLVTICSAFVHLYEAVLSPGAKTTVSQPFWGDCNINKMFS